MKEFLLQKPQEAQLPASYHRFKIKSCPKTQIPLFHSKNWGGLAIPKYSLGNQQRNVISFLGSQFGALYKASLGPDEVKEILRMMAGEEEMVDP